MAGYTIGQRKGIGAFGEKRFVTSIDPQLNLVTIGDEDDLFARRLVAETPSWVNGEPPALEFEADGQGALQEPAHACDAYVSLTTASRCSSSVPSAP